MSSTNQRFTAVQKHPRYTLRTPVDVVTPTAQVESLALENISLGGVFIRTSRPSPKGSTLRMRIRTPDDSVTLGVVGRVVHVIDEAQANEKAHPPGMGVEFEGMSPVTQAMLERFVEGIVDGVRRERARRGAARFAPAAAVLISTERSVVAELWAQGMQANALYVESPEAPTLGSRVGVSVGPLALLGDVVHIDQGRGFGVSLLDLSGNKREALKAYVEGTAQTINVEEVKVVGPPLGKVLAAARRLFTGIEESDPFGGVGLPGTATEDEIRERCAGMVRLFATTRPDASPPQAARIEAACRAVSKVEPLLLARCAALRKQAELATTPDVAVQDEVRQLLTTAHALEARGDRAEARRTLERALELAPDDEVVIKRLSAVTIAMDTLKAAELVKSAEVFVHGVGMRAEAIKRAREAAQLTQHRDVRLLCVRVLAKAGETDVAARIAQELVDVDPRDALALQALFALHEKARDFRAAIRAGEALSRLKPGDSDLKKKLAKMIDEIRR